MEGICYGTEDILRRMREKDFEPKEGVVCGGPPRSVAVRARNVGAPSRGQMPGVNRHP